MADPRRLTESKDVLASTAYAKRDGSSEDAYPISVGLNLPPWDYLSMALSGGNTTETYTFKINGSGGSTVATVVIVYTDSTRAVISTVTKTYS